MKGLVRRKIDNTLTVTMPFSGEEKKILDKFLKCNGLKKGAFVRKAILERLDRIEGERG